MLTGRADALDGEAAILGAGLVALQEDLNNNGQQIDQLGGAVDGLSDALAALDGRGMITPGDVDYWPAAESLQWHLGNVFRER